MSLLYRKYRRVQSCSRTGHHTISPLRVMPQLLKAQIAGSTADSSMTDSGYVCFWGCSKAKRWLWCLNCRDEPVKLNVCLNCSVQLRHCQVCRSEKIIIGPLDIPLETRIRRIAIGVKPFEFAPINWILKALELPTWMPELVRVYSFSELYMTHFRLYCQVSRSKWLRLERVEDFKGVTGGVHLKVLREPDCRLGSRIESDTFGDRIVHTIICDVQENVDFRLQDLLQFRQDQSRVAYDLLFNNCQHFVFKALQHIGAPPAHTFPHWARRLQEEWRRYA